MHDIKCLTVLSADRVWREDNGKFGMAGIFERLNALEYPSQIMPFFLYVRLSDVNAGKHELITRVIAENELADIASVTLTFETPEDAAVFQIHYPIPPLQLHNPGDYAVHLSIDGVEIAKHIIRAFVVGGA